MKIYKYVVKTYASIIDFTHSEYQYQTRIYIPNQALLGFIDKEKIDFFSDNPKNLSKVERCIRGEERDIEMKDIKSVEIPDEIVSEIVSTGKAMNQARELFQESSKSLIDLVL